MKVGMVHRVKIINRKNCCGNRLKNADVRAGLSKVDVDKTGIITENSFCGNYKGPGSNGETIVINCKEAIKSRYVTLQLMNNEKSTLNLAEVEVYGKGICIS